MTSVTDLVTDADILALDTDLIKLFGETVDPSARLLDKRRLAHQWCVNAVSQSGRNPRLWNLRRPADAIYAVGSPTVNSDVTNLLRAGGTGYALSAMGTSMSLRVGHRLPYRGLAFDLFPSSVNTNSLSVASFTLWTGGWDQVDSLVDGTMQNSISFAKGGVLRFQPKDEWMRRVPLASSLTVGSSMYFTQISMTVAPSASTFLVQASPIIKSRLTDAAALRTLFLLYYSSSMANRGRFTDQAEGYRALAADALASGLVAMNDEIDADDSGQTEPVEVASVAPPLSSLWEFERG